MEKKKLKIVLTEEASDNIDGITLYITEKGYPDTAHKFRKKLYDFARSLVIFPEKYTISRHEKYKKRKLRCAPYKNYIFIYKVIRNKLVIYNIVHGSAVH